jgi:hypothetical protein
MKKIKFNINFYAPSHFAPYVAGQGRFDKAALFYQVSLVDVTFSSES